jgi:hypothetical protein
MATKADRIVVRLESEMRAKLREKASALGLDDAAYVRMLIYRDANELPGAGLKLWDESTRTHRGTNPDQFLFEQLQPSHQLSGEVPHDALRGDEGAAEQPEPLPVEEMDIPADPDGGNPGALGELLGASTSILDEMMAMSRPAPEQPMQRQMPRQAQRTYRPALSNRNRGVQPMYGPGSLTRVVGLNDQTIGANDFGDGRGNVLRDNMRHLGITGTRAR